MTSEVLLPVLLVLIIMELYVACMMIQVIFGISIPPVAAVMLFTLGIIRIYHSVLKAERKRRSKEMYSSFRAEAVEKRHRCPKCGHLYDVYELEGEDNPVYRCPRCGSKEEKQ